MRKVILHISDLHVSLHEDLKGNVPRKMNSWLTTNPTDTISQEFIKSFCTYVNSKFKNTEFTLLITGDIADKSEVREYEFANKFLYTIVDELKIGNSNILLIPGDHDINRRLNESAFREGRERNETQKSYEYREKYANFETCFHALKGSNFDATKSIVGLVDFADEKLILIGLNSNYIIDYEGGLGFISPENLRMELKQLDSKYASYSKIVAFHHNIYSSYENSNTGQWDANNRKEIIAILNEYAVKCILYGNEHTRDSKLFGANKADLMFRSDSGCFASKNLQASFKSYELLHSKEKFSLKNSLYVLQNSNKIDEQLFGVWGIQDNSDLKEVEEIVLIEIPSEKLTEIDILDKVTTSLVEDSKSSDIEKIEKLYLNSFYRDKFFGLIKEKKLFHSGHFHWSETSRAHNWIDVSKILNNKDDLLAAKNAIIDVIDSCEIKEKFDFVIGLGIEGNILSTRVSVKYNKPYSFLPYSYRYDEHNEYERKLNFVNDQQFKSVLIITDVVNDGRTLRKLINKREPKFFEFVEKIFVVSLFYTGDNIVKSTKILNNVAGQYDAKNDHLENRIEYYYVLAIKVEKCPYGENYESDCIIVKENLGCVYNFYDNIKAKKKSSGETHLL